jgi:drug/metabolite transporter (DMT)-like permease
MGTADGPLMVELGILLALLSALAANVAFLCKHRGAVAAPVVELRHPLRSGADLFRSRWWAIGFAIAVAAWGLHVAALAMAPLSLVQAVIAGGLVLLSWPAERWFGCHLGTREWVGLGLAGAGLAFLALTASGHATQTDYSVGGMIAFEAAAIGLGLALLFSAHQGDGKPNHGLLLGVAGGLMIGVANVAIKALVDAVPGGVGAILSPWTLVAIVAGIGSFYAVARSLQVGRVIEVITVTSVAANCAAVLGGVLVFGDPIGADLLEGLARGAAFAMVIAAAVLVPGPARAAGARA